MQAVNEKHDDETHVDSLQLLIQIEIEFFLCQALDGPSTDGVFDVVYADVLGSGVVLLGRNSGVGSSAFELQLQTFGGRLGLEKTTIQFDGRCG